MERYLSITLTKIRHKGNFIDYIDKIYKYIVSIKNISHRFTNFYLQGETEEEARKYEVPEHNPQFVEILRHAGVYPCPGKRRFALGLWNGMSAQPESRSLHLNFSYEASERPFFDHRAEAIFFFPFLHDESDVEVSREISQLVPLAFELLPCSFITEYDFNYISHYNAIPDLIVGSALYGRKTELAGVEGMRRDINDELVVLSPVVGPFDSGNPEHVTKAHDWEKYLLRNPEFRQLLLR